MEVKRQKHIFALLRAGYEDLFDLAGGDGDYVANRVKDLQSQIKDGLMIGIHVRHGDKHPWEFQYQKSYVPLEKYVEEARGMMQDAFTLKNGSVDPARTSASKLVLASDDPEVYNSTELSHAVRAQAKILLASKAHVDAAQGSDRFVDNNLGWEGGFFKDIFWGLGDPNTSTSARSLRQREEQLERGGRTEPSAEALQLRALVGKAYLLDLAVVGKADRIVCTVSSIGCRLLAVMMGWEDAILKERWHSIDGSFHWTGIRW